MNINRRYNGSILLCDVLVLGLGGLGVCGLVCDVSIVDYTCVLRLC